MWFQQARGTSHTARETILPLRAAFIEARNVSTFLPCEDIAWADLFSIHAVLIHYTFLLAIPERKSLFYKSDHFTRPQTQHMDAHFNFGALTSFI